MLNLFINFFEKGDTQSLVNTILHTGFWQQHQFKAYGHAQIGEMMGRWLSLVGRCDTCLLSEVSQLDRTFFLLKLQPRNADNSFIIAIDVHHNNQVIKFVRCIVDTQQVSANMRSTAKSISLLLPKSDPLLVSDYDHQNHLQSDHATPSMLLSGTGLEMQLDHWWRIWTVGQLSEIALCYDEHATVYFPGAAEDINREQLFSAIGNLRNQFKRIFCQIESIAVEGDRAIIFWYLEGDEAGLHQRQRLSFCSALIFNKTTIVQDFLITDLAAYYNQYKESKLSVNAP